MKSIALLLAICCGTPVAAESAKGPSRDRKIQDLKKRVQENDYQAILELGDQNDRSLVPMLRELKKDARQFRGPGANAQMALAKLGETREFEEILKELKSDEPGAQDEAIEKLVYVGGPRAIKSLAELLGTREGRRPKWNMPGAKTHPKGKVIYLPLSWMAARALGRVVENKPANAKGDLSEEEASIWRTWWENNRDKYK